MSRADYAHWNEEQDIIWWQEEGRHEPVDPGHGDDDEDFVPDDGEED